MPQEMYLAIQPMLILNDEGREFEVYMRLKNDYILYAKKGKLTSKHKELLYNNEVKFLYIKSKEKENYEKHIEKNFKRILQDEAIPLNVRVNVLYEHGTTVAESIYGSSFPIIADKAVLRKLRTFVDVSFNFFSKNSSAFVKLQKIISHNYKTYTHCIHVMTYSYFILQRMNADEKLLRKVGLGAMLHDIGKTAISNIILDKPGRLTPEEFEIIKTHPVKGMLICQQINLPQVSANCVLFHHEKLDGSGYPAKSPDIPDYVRALTIADIYDALVSIRPYNKAYSPFEALGIMKKEVERGKLDNDMYKIFVGLLSQAKITA